MSDELDELCKICSNESCKELTSDVVKEQKIKECREVAKKKGVVKDES